MVKFAVDEFVVPSGGGAVSLFAGFQPNAAILWWTGAFDGSLQGQPPQADNLTYFKNARAGFGYGVAADNGGTTEEYAVGWGTGRFDEATFAGGTHRTDRCMIGANKVDSHMWSATVTSWVSNGINLNTFADPGFYSGRVVALLIQTDNAGVDFTSFGTGATGVYSLNVGFPGDLAFVPYLMAGGGGGFGGESSAGLGVADRLSGTTGTVVGGGQDMASGSAGEDGYSYANDGPFLFAGIPDGSLSQNGRLWSWDSDGMNVIVDNAPNPGKIGALILQGVRGKIQSVTYDQHTTHGGTVSYTGVGYAPEAAMALTQLSEEGLVAQGVRNTVGAAHGTGLGVQVGIGQNARQGINAKPHWPMMYTDSFLPVVSTPTAAAVLDMKTFDPDGATVETVREGSTTNIGSQFDLQMVSLASVAFQAEVTVPVLVNPGTEVTTDRSLTVQVPTTFSFDTTISTAGGDITAGLIADFDVVTQHLSFQWKTPDGEAIFRVPPRDDLHIVE